MATGLTDDFIDKAKIVIESGNDCLYNTEYGNFAITKHRDSERFVFTIPEPNKRVQFSTRTKNQGVLVDITNRMKAQKSLRKILMRADKERKEELTS